MCVFQSVFHLFINDWKRALVVTEDQQTQESETFWTFFILKCWKKHIQLDILACETSAVSNCY